MSETGWLFQKEVVAIHGRSRMNVLVSAAAKGYLCCRLVFRTREGTLGGIDPSRTLFGIHDPEDPLPHELLSYGKTISLWKRRVHEIAARELFQGFSLVLRRNLYLRGIESFAPDRVWEDKVHRSICVTFGPMRFVFFRGEHTKGVVPGKHAVGENARHLLVVRNGLPRGSVLYNEFGTRHDILSSHAWEWANGFATEVPREKKVVLRKKRRKKGAAA